MVTRTMLRGSRGPPGAQPESRSINRTHLSLMLTFFEALVGLLVLQSLGIAAEIAQGLGEVQMRGSVVGIETNRHLYSGGRSGGRASVRRGGGSLWAGHREAGIGGDG